MSFPKGARFTEGKPPDTPGPGQYDALSALNADAKHKQFGMLEKGKRFQDIKMEETPEFYLGVSDPFAPKLQQQQQLSLAARFARIGSDNGFKGRKEVEDQITVYQKKTVELERTMEGLVVDLQRAEADRRQLIKDKSTFESERRKRDIDMRQKDEHLAKLMDTIEKQESKIMSLQTNNKDRVSVAQTQQRLLRDKEKAQNDARTTRETMQKLNDELQHVKVLLTTKTEETIRLKEQIQGCLQQIDILTQTLQQQQQELLDANNREEKLQHSIANFDMQSTQLSQELTRQADEFNQYKNDTAAIEQESLSLREDNHKLEKKCFEVKARADTLVREYTAVETRYKEQIVTLTAQLSDANHKIRHTEVQAEQLLTSANEFSNNKIVELTAVGELSSIQIIEQASEISTLQEQIITYKTVDATLKEKVAHYEEQLRETHYSNNSYQQQVSGLQVLHEQSILRVDKLLESEHQLKDALSVKETELLSLTSTLRELENRLQQMQTDMQSSDERIRILLALEQEFREQLVLSSELCDSKTTLAASLKLDNDHMLEQISTLVTQLKDVESLREERDNMQEYITVLTAQLSNAKTLELQRDSMQEQISELTVQLSNVEALKLERNNMQEQIMEFTAQLSNTKALTIERDSMQECIAELTTQLGNAKALKLERDSMQEQITEFTVQLSNAKTLKLERDSMQGQVIELTAQLNSAKVLKLEYDSLQQQLTATQATANQYQIIETRLRAELKECTAESKLACDHIQGQFEQERRMLHQVGCERDNLLHEVKAARKDYETLKLEADQYLDVIRDFQSDMVSHRQHADAQQTSLVSVNRQLEHERFEYLKKTERAQHELETSQNELKTMQHDLKTTHHELKTTQNKLETTYRAYDAQISALHVEKQVLEEEVFHKGDAFNQQTKIVLELQRKLGDQASLLNNHTKLIHTLEEHKMDVEQERHQLSMQLTRLQRAYEIEIDGRVDMLETIDGLYSRLSQQFNDIRSQAAHAQELEVRILSAEQDHEVDINQIDALQAQVTLQQLQSAGQAELMSSYTNELKDLRIQIEGNEDTTSMHALGLLQLNADKEELYDSMLRLLLDEHATAGVQLASAMDDIAGLSTAFTTALNLQKDVIADKCSAEDVREECKNLRSQLETASERVDHVKHRAEFRVQQLKHALSNATDKISSLEKKLQAIRNDYDNKKLAMEIARLKEVKEQTDKRNTLELASTRQENQTLTATLKELNSGMARSQEELQKATQKSHSLTQERDKLLDTLQMQQDILQRNSSVFTKEMEEINRISAELLGHSNPQQKIKYVAKLKDENTSLKQENTQLRRARDHTRQRLSHLEAELDSYRAQDAPIGSKRRAPMEQPLVPATYRNGRDTISRAL